ncbi:hypothetical protein [Rathayibacter sp. VKM Ac-2760]|nr:hypothetical protein [Rathayibacter sp. VKM Ac-2760]QHC58233.1 hypothetical protein GSU72_06465 [Rathayibacter sp. VKM Ac-2760]
MLLLLTLLTAVLLTALALPLALAIRSDGLSPVAFDPGHDSRGGAS